MDFLHKVSIFRRVVENGSIAGAARVMRMSSAAVSRGLSTLEAELATELIARTTRSMRVTDAGLCFYEHCVRIEAEVERAKSSLERPDAMSGKLSVSAPVSLGLERITPLIPSLSAHHSGLEVELRLEDRAVDLIVEGVDVAIRAGAAPKTSSSLIVRELYRAKLVCVGSPSYLRSRGLPATPEQLTKHDALLHVPSASAHAARSWEFSRGRRKLRVELRGPFRSTALAALKCAALRGLGIARLPDWMVREYLLRGDLLAVLTEYDAPGIDVFALYRAELRRDPRVKAFVDHLRKAFQ